MLWDMTYWLYFSNAVLLINHEIDSAYWREWELFGMKGGITLFLLLHVPMIAALLYGLLEVYKQTFPGLVLSLIVSGAGICAFCIHIYFLARGREQFRKAVSIIILALTLAVSSLQAVMSILLFFAD